MSEEIRLGERASRIRAARNAEWIREARAITPWQRDGERRLVQLRDSVLADGQVTDPQLAELYDAVNSSLRPRVVVWVAHRGAGEILWGRVLTDWSHWPALVEWMCAHETARRMSALRGIVRRSGSPDARCLLLEDAEGEEAAALLDLLWGVNEGREVSLHLGVYGLPERWKGDKPILTKLLSHPSAELRVQVMRFFGADAPGPEESSRREQQVGEWRRAFLDRGRLEQD